MHRFAGNFNHYLTMCFFNLLSITTKCSVQSNDVRECPKVVAACFCRILTGSLYSLAAGFGQYFGFLSEMLSNHGESGREIRELI